MDDMVLTNDDPYEIKALQEYLIIEFDMKDLNQLKYYLKIGFKFKIWNFLVTKKIHAKSITKTGMLDWKPIEMPIKMNHKLEEYPDQLLTNKDH